MKWPVLIVLRAYRLSVSPFLGQRCRYYPSCSAYAEEAVALHGARRGGALALWRLLRCNPWSQGGVDLVPGSRFLEEHPVLGSETENLVLEKA